ncbi:MAG: hypothetical protein KDK64_00615 [Chlamydiia bacterium]|nr:hypothetical protein [Chlamydiia bacterium]
MTESIRVADKAQTMQTSQTVKIPGFFERLAMKFMALFGNADTKPFEAIADQYSKGAKLWDRELQPDVLRKLEGEAKDYQTAIREIDKKPTPRLTEIKQNIDETQRKIASLERQYDQTYEDVEIAYSGGSGYDGSQDRARIYGEIGQAKSEFRSLEAQLKAERQAIAIEKGITLPQPASSLRFEVKRTADLYKSVAANIVAEHQKQPQLTIEEAVVLSMPTWNSLSDAEMRSIENFVRDAQQPH